VLNPPHFTSCAFQCCVLANSERVPSIPGFGFSYNPERRGFEYPQIAESFNSLMSALGYKTYVAQGGDIGSFISCQLGQSYPECCRAVLVNMLVAPPPQFAKSPLAWIKWTTAPHLFYSRAEMDHLARTAWFFKGEAGYQVGPSGHHFLVISDLSCRQYRVQSRRASVMVCGIRP
jgi:pimeloyl-ACP methyl ester carboxylesterase